MKFKQFNRRMMIKVSKADLFLWGVIASFLIAGVAAVGVASMLLTVIQYTKFK